jgi:hypothetical protein
MFVNVFDDYYINIYHLTISLAYLMDSVIFFCHHTNDQIGMYVYKFYVHSHLKLKAKKKLRISIVALWIDVGLLFSVS